MKEKSIRSNMIFSIVLSASKYIFPLVSYAYVARVLTPTGTGKVAYVFSIISYFSYFSMLGIPSYGVRECAKYKDDNQHLSKVTSELFTITLIASIVSYILLAIALNVLDGLRKYSLLFISMSPYIILNAIGVEWLYQALEEYRYIAIRTLIFRTISTILIFVFIRDMNDYVLYGILIVFTTSASNLLNFINLRKIVRLRNPFSRDILLHFKPAIILFLASIAINIYSNFDVTMLGTLGTETEVGLYNATYKIRNIIVSLATAVSTVVIPRIAYHWEKNEFEGIKELVSRVFLVDCCLVVPICIYVSFFPKQVLNVICGGEYQSAWPTLIIMAICALIMSISNISGQTILIPLGGEKDFTISTVIGLILNVILNTVFIPIIGALGAALGTLITEIWNAIFLTIICRRRFSININYHLMLIKYMMAAVFSGCIIFGIAVYLLRWESFCITRLFFTSGFFYILFYIIMILLRDDFAIKTLDYAIKKIKLVMKWSE